MTAMARGQQQVAASCSYRWLVRRRVSVRFATHLKSEMLAPTKKRFVVLQEDEGLSVALVILIDRQCIDA